MITRLHPSGRTAGVLSLLIASALHLPAQIALEKGDGELSIRIDEKPFATYVWNDPKTTRPYFKRVHAPGGEVQITRNHPPEPGDLDDHATYHPGIWWGFGDVGGNDYWRLKAKVVGGEFVEGPTGGDDRGTFTVRNRMLTNDGDQTFCTQLCRFTILKRPGGILLVCESTMIRNEDDFWLGDQEEMGLAIRVATPIATKSNKGGQMRDNAGRTAEEDLRTNQGDWCDYSGPIAGKHGGILLMNDPANFRKPWWHAVDTGLLIANPLGESELSGKGKRRKNVKVEKGEPFRLRYGALIHLHQNPAGFDPAKAHRDFLEVLPTVPVINPALATKKTSALPPGLPIVPDGFEISVFAQEPLVYKPTAVCFDARGRLVVGQGPQYPKNLPDSPTDSVALLLDTDQDGVADQAKTFATGFNSIQGLAWKGNDLYVANAPELTVVRDLDGDDEADEYVVIYTDLGNREHALHGLNFAPDGKLYMSKGNSKGHNQPDKYGYVAPRPFRELWDVVHPPGAPDSYPPKSFTKDTYKKTYHHWDDDWGREGGVLRCEPMGASLEIVSRGMRNPWDITLDDGFNWLGTDNDQDQGDRIIMPFYGAHFGWGHTYSNHWTGDGHLPTAPISGPVFPGSGAGIIYYDHSHFPANYRGAFFINDWMHGTYVYRPSWEGSLMQPEGGRWEHFARRGEGDILYRPTDLEFGPDGSIYICGWGGGYHYDRKKEGSWIFRIRHAQPAEPDPANPAPIPPPNKDKRTVPLTEWSLAQLLDDLGPDALPVWRVNAQDELVRRGKDLRPALAHRIISSGLSTGQQTWAAWALGRTAPQDPSIDKVIANWLEPKARMPLNLRIQALRILAHRIRNHAPDRKLPAAAIAALADPEPRLRLEAVQAIWQARQREHLPALLDQLAKEDDRLVFYSGWRALGELTDADFRKALLGNDPRPGSRLGELLSLLERHEMNLDEALALAERDPDERIQHWVLTWAMNPQPPKKMPNTTARVELEESVSIRDLIKRARDAKTEKLRDVYLAMISRATYRGGDAWKELHEFYQSLDSEHARALVLVPLGREMAAKPILWEALGSSDTLARPAIQALAGLARRAGSSPEDIAAFLLDNLGKTPKGAAASNAIDALSRLGLASNWNPPAGWDAAIAPCLTDLADDSTRSKLLTLLLVVDPARLAEAEHLKHAVEAVCIDSNTRHYAALQALQSRLGLAVTLHPPEPATVDRVLAKLSDADPERGRALFFSTTHSTGCFACHRVSGKGKALAPDLSGIGLRAKPETIAQSIIEPSATITEGYQLQAIEARNGAVFLGAVLRESDSEIQLVRLDGSLETVRTRSVIKRTKLPQSAMPADFAVLGNEHVADLVAYLSTLRHAGSDVVR